MRYQFLTPLFVLVPTQKVILAVFVVGLVAVGTIAFFRQPAKEVQPNPPVFSKRTMLEALWFQYKNDYLEAGSLRALDRQREDITTSEGQSYTMLRAVWVDDKATFDQAWQWTKDNMRREEDHLISWLFGELPDGSYGILRDEGGYNSAPDANIDIALALLFASKRWNDNDYFGDAIGLIRDIWTHEVAVINGKPYLLANNLEKQDRTKDYYLINPSYYAPYAFRVFQEVDPENDWLGLVDTSYEILFANQDSPLDTGKSVGLPSDWLALDRQTAEIKAVPNSRQLTTNYSYDALRIPWRIALDAHWFNEARAIQTLEKLSYLSTEMETRGQIATAYRHDGTVVEDKETAAMYGGAIGYFMIADKTLGQSVYQTKLEGLYNPDIYDWREPKSYYDANWGWFGLALYNDYLQLLYPVTP